MGKSEASTSAAAAAGGSSFRERLKSAKGKQSKHDAELEEHLNDRSLHEGSQNDPMDLEPPKKAAPPGMRWAAQEASSSSDEGESGEESSDDEQLEDTEETKKPQQDQESGDEEEEEEEDSDKESKARKVVASGVRNLEQLPGIPEGVRTYVTLEELRAGEIVVWGNFWPSCWQKDNQWKVGLADMQKNKRRVTWVMLKDGVIWEAYRKEGSKELYLIPKSARQAIWKNVKAGDGAVPETARHCDIDRESEYETRVPLVSRALFYERIADRNRSKTKTADGSSTPSSDGRSSTASTSRAAASGDRSKKRKATQERRVADKEDLTSLDVRGLHPFELAKADQRSAKIQQQQQREHAPRKESAAPEDAEASDEEPSKQNGGSDAAKKKKKKQKKKKKPFDDEMDIDEREDEEQQQQDERNREQREKELARKKAESEAAERKEAERKKAEREKAEREEKEREEKEREEKEREEKERKEKERKEKERKEKERKEKERKEKERKEAERKEAERKEAEREEAEREEAERKEAERKEAERKEKERKRAEEEEAERQYAERHERARKEEERKESERKAAEQKRHEQEEKRKKQEEAMKKRDEQEEASDGKVKKKNKSPFASARQPPEEESRPVKTKKRLAISQRAGAVYQEDGSSSDEEGSSESGSSDDEQEDDDQANSSDEEEDGRPSAKRQKSPFGKAVPSRPTKSAPVAKSKAKPAPVKQKKADSPVPSRRSTKPKAEVDKNKYYTPPYEPLATREFFLLHEHRMAVRDRCMRQSKKAARSSKARDDVDSMDEDDTDLVWPPRYEHRINFEAIKESRDLAQELGGNKQAFFVLHCMSLMMALPGHVTAGAGKESLLAADELDENATLNLFDSAEDGKYGMPAYEAKKRYAAHKMAKLAGYSCNVGAPLPSNVGFRKADEFWKTLCRIAFTNIVKKPGVEPGRRGKDKEPIPLLGARSVEAFARGCQEQGYKPELLMQVFNRVFELKTDQKKSATDQKKLVLKQQPVSPKKRKHSESAKKSSSSKKSSAKKSSSSDDKKKKKKKKSKHEEQRKKHKKQAKKQTPPSSDESDSSSSEEDD